MIEVMGYAEHININKITRAIFVRVGSSVKLLSKLLSPRFFAPRSTCASAIVATRLRMRRTDISSFVRERFYRPTKLFWMG